MMRYLKKVVSLVNLMVPRLNHTRAITGPSLHPGNKVSTSIMRQYYNNVYLGPLRQLYRSRARSSFSLMICTFGLVSAGRISQGTSQNDLSYKPATTTEEQEFRNSIMRYLRKVVHLTYLMVHRLYHTRTISLTRPSRFPAVALGFIGTIFWQLRKFHTSIPSERANITSITAIEPKFPIFCELRLYVKHNATGHQSQSVSCYVHGFWMCFIDNSVTLHHFTNDMPTKSDFSRGKQDLAELDDVTSFDLRFMWPSFTVPEIKFWLEQFVKHALTSVGVYREHYFRDVVSISRPYIGGEKDIARFLNSNYQHGVVYDAQIFRGELSKHVGADVQIIRNNSMPQYLQEIGILFTMDGKALVNHPKARAARGNIIVKLHEGGSV